MLYFPESVKTFAGLCKNPASHDNSQPISMAGNNKRYILFIYN